MKKLTNLFKAARGSLLTFAALLMTGATSALADVDPSFLVNGSGEGSDTEGMFDGITNLTADAASSLRTLVVVLAVAILVIVLIISAIQYSSDDAQKKQRAKERAGRTVIAAVIVFAAVAIISFAASISTKLSENLTEAENQNSLGDNIMGYDESESPIYVSCNYSGYVACVNGNYAGCYTPVDAANKGKVWYFETSVTDASGNIVQKVDTDHPIYGLWAPSGN